MSWSWFLEQFRQYVARDWNPICIIYDRHNDILNAIANVDYLQESWTYHRFYLWHIFSNLMTKFKCFNEQVQGYT